MNCYLLLVEIYQLSQLLVYPATFLFPGCSRNAAAVAQGSRAGAITSTTSLSGLLDGEGQTRGSPLAVKIVGVV